MNRRYLVSTGLIALALVASGCSSNHKIASNAPPKSQVQPLATSAVAGSTVAGSTAAKSSASAPVLTADWVKRTAFAAMPHPALNCAKALRGAVEVHSVRSADVTGDGAPEALVRISCLASTSAWPDVVEIYSDSAGKPALIDTLLHQDDTLLVRDLATAAKTVTLSEATWSTFTALCCPDLQYTQTFTWNGHSFDAGARQDVLHACAGAGSSLLTQGSRVDGAAGTSSMVLTFRNRLPQACTLTGYPGVDALTKSGGVLAHAKRTLRGNAGGAAGVNTVRLAPGAVASATIEWRNFGSNGLSCAMSASIVATPANTQDSTTLPVSVSVCELQVHPTVAGSSGRS